jgi:hypothetical protein
MVTYTAATSWSVMAKDGSEKQNRRFKGSGGGSLPVYMYFVYKNSPRGSGDAYRRVNRKKLSSAHNERPTLIWAEKLSSLGLLRWPKINQLPVVRGLPTVDEIGGPRSMANCVGSFNIDPQNVTPRHGRKRWKKCQAREEMQWARFNC